MITFHLPWLPPTDNNAYENIPVRMFRGKHVGGGRRLSEEGRTFKVELTNYLARTYIQELREFKKNTRYVVWCIFYFDALVNKGWPNKTDTRYKKIDATNRSKLMLDTIAELTGCDDSTYFDVVFSKREGTERTEVTMWDAETEEVYFALGRKER